MCASSGFIALKNGLGETRRDVRTGKEDGRVSSVSSVGRELEERSRVLRCSNGGNRRSRDVMEQEERERDVREERMR